MGIRSPTGLELCKLRLWFAWEFATTRTERSGCPPASWVQGCGSAVRTKAEWSGGALSREAKAGRAWRLPLLGDVDAGLPDQLPLS
jgi:hypothetical protein